MNNKIRLYEGDYVVLDNDGQPLRFAGDNKIALFGDMEEAKELGGVVISCTSLDKPLRDELIEQIKEQSEILETQRQLPAYKEIMQRMTENTGH